jgi:hypothetical protein
VVPTSEKDWTYRPRSWVPATAGTVLVAAGFTAAQWAYGAEAGLRALPLGLAGALLGWLVFGKPCVRVTGEGVDVVNPFVGYHVPWAALVHIRTRFAATLVTPHRDVQAFAAPGPGRHAAVTADVRDLRAIGRTGAEGADLGELPSAPSGQVAAVVRRRWQALVESGELAAGEADETPVTRQVDVRALVTLGALVAAGVALQLAR